MASYHSIKNNYSLNWKDVRPRRQIEAAITPKEAEGAANDSDALVTNHR